MNKSFSTAYFSDLGNATSFNSISDNEMLRQNSNATISQSQEKSSDSHDWIVKEPLLSSPDNLLSALDVSNSSESSYSLDSLD